MDQLRQAQRKIRAALESGHYLTTSLGNKMAKTTEFRKIVSRLRKIGVDVKDIWMVINKRRFKIYYCEQKNTN